MCIDIVDEAQDVAAMELYSQRSIAAGDVPRRTGRQASGESIHAPAASGRRLDDEMRVASLEQGNDGLAPAAVMGQLDHVRTRKPSAPGVFREQVHRGNRLDVSRQEQRTDPRFRFESIVRRRRCREAEPASLPDPDSEHDRRIVVTSRTEVSWRPEYVPDRIADPDAVPHGHGLDATSVESCRIEQFRDRLRPLRCREERVVDDQPPDARESDEIDGPAVVIEIGMTDDERIDSSTAIEDPRKHAPARD